MRDRILIPQLLAIWLVAVGALGPVDERLIGWLGEVYGKGGANGSMAAQDRPGMQILSWDPRIMLYRKFLSEEECDQLRALAKPKLERSGVSNAVTGAEEVDDVRTSSGMFFARGSNPLIARIEERIAAWTMLPVKNGEGLQVLQYLKSQRYDPHHDYFNHERKDDNGGNRIATVLMYLTEPEAGGETVFPHVHAPPDQTAAAGYSQCALQGYAVRPRKGDAVLFWSIRPDGTFDYKSYHGSCPVISGEKWSATKWIRVGTYGHDSKPVHRVIHVPPPPPVPAGCVDNHKLCGTWAEEGECETNSGYMVGSQDEPGACLKSCQRCDLMPLATAGTKQ